MISTMLPVTASLVCSLAAGWCAAWLGYWIPYQMEREWQNEVIAGYGGAGPSPPIRQWPSRFVYVGMSLLMLSVSGVDVWVIGPTSALTPVLVASWLLFGMSLIDARTRLLPDALTMTLMWLGLLTSVVQDSAHWSVTPGEAILGAASGYLVLWIVAKCFYLISGREGMGHGDFKLLAALGAWIGWTELPLVLLISSAVGLVGAICLALSRRLADDRSLPFGPCLAIAGWVALLWGPEITNAYLGR